MASKYVDQIMTETGKSEKEVLSAWERAKEVTEDTYGIDESSFERKHFDFARRTAYSILGFNESINVADFMKSDKSAKDYIEELMSGAVTTSGQFDIDNAVKTDYPKDTDIEDITQHDREEPEDRESKEYDFDELGSETHRDEDEYEEEE